MLCEGCGYFITLNPSLILLARVGSYSPFGKHAVCDHPFPLNDEEGRNKNDACVRVLVMVLG